MLPWLALVIAALISVFVALPADTSGIDSIPGLAIAASVAAVLIALYVAASSQTHSGDGRSAPATLTAVAILVAGLAIAAYVLKDNPSAMALWPANLRSEIQPQGTNHGAAAIRIRRDDAGRFIAHGDVNGASVDLLLDTGASVVMLRHSDAEEAGIDMTNLTFNTPVETANGTAYAASVRLRSVAVGPVRADDVEALVVPAGSLNESLLGMSFLRRLTSYDLKGDFLTLRQ